MERPSHSALSRGGETFTQTRPERINPQNVVMMLKLENVHTCYGQIEALKGVSLDVHPGEIVTLIGANGAGKSTLLMTICGSPHASRGTVVFEGQDITRKPTHVIMQCGLALVPEGRRIFPSLTVRENLQMGGFFADNFGE